MAVTLRVYDAGKKYENYPDRYSLYTPTPRNKVKDWGYMGIFQGFNFSVNSITKCTHDECKYGIGLDCFLGKRIKRDTLPIHVQQWIDKQEQLYNKAIKEDTQQAWDNYNTCN